MHHGPPAEADRSAQERQRSRRSSKVALRRSREVCEGARATRGGGGEARSGVREAHPGGREDRRSQTTLLRAESEEYSCGCQGCSSHQGYSSYRECPPGLQQGSFGLPWDFIQHPPAFQHAAAARCSGCGSHLFRLPQLGPKHSISANQQARGLAWKPCPACRQSPSRTQPAGKQSPDQSLRGDQFVRRTNAGKQPPRRSC